MRATLAALVLISSLSACAIQPGPTDGPRRDRPLQARILPHSYDGLTFQVNRQSHVALFEIVPGRGTSLVYPSPGLGRMDGFVFAGLHDLNRLVRHNSAQYLPASFATGGGPRFYFLIASEQPLDLDRFGGYGMGLRSAMGRQFAAFNAYGAMETLATMVLPSAVNDDGWTSDMYVHWPEVLHDRRSAGLVPLTCNGYTMYVPFEQLLAVRQAICGPMDESPTPPVVPGDSAGGETGIVQPKRRAPLPKAQAAELRERITSSTQLERRQPEEARGARSASERFRGVREVEPLGAEPRARSGVRAGQQGRAARDRGADAGSAEPRSAPPPSRPAAEPSRPAVREPAARPIPRSGDAPRAQPRRPGCDPCRLQ